MIATKMTSLFFYFLRQGLSTWLLDGLEFTLYNKLTSDSQRFACLSLPGARVKAVHHHDRPSLS